VKFHAMGTEWSIECDEPRHLGAARALVDTLEARLSRFRPESALSRLNRDRHATCATLATVTRRALELRVGTDGKFDPTLGGELAALGYDRTYERLVDRSPERSSHRPAPRATSVVVDGDDVYLDGPGLLDLGGLGKGFAVDAALALLLELGATTVLVDGGGDLRGAGASVPIGVGDGLAIETRHGAIATSSTHERRWRLADGTSLHHILDPRSGRPAAAGIDTATVVAPDATTADALATALLVDPIAVIPRLATFDAHALVRSYDGRWWTTPGVVFVAADAAADATGGAA